MAEEKQKTEHKTNHNKVECHDKLCPFHGQMSLRGRSFRGHVIRKFPKRIVIEFERTLFIAKYERYSKRKTKLHARLPDCLFNEINVGDYVEIMECRPISKMIHFMTIKKISSEEKETKISEEKK
jgi:small subunit ribosomal protein S17